MKQKIKDKILLLRLKHQRDPETFSRVYDDHIDQIYRFVLFKVSSKEIAEDITSEVFLKTWQYIQDRSKEIGDIRAFLYRIARNLVIDFYRERAKNSTIPLDENFINLPNKEDIRITVEQKDSLEEIYRAMRKLKNEYQEVLLLRFVDELSTSEIASVLEKKRGAVRVLLSRAERALKNIMNDSRKNENQTPDENFFKKTI